MDPVGVREVRQNLSRYLERVRRGESLLVTDHGRPVAVLSPIVADPLEDMRARGLVREARASFDDFELPEPPAGGGSALSDGLASMRDEDRF